MLGGYTGRLLKVNLSTGTTFEEHIPESELRKYLGGVGLAAKYFMQQVAPETDPLAPENPIIFSAGPWTGTVVPTSGRHAVVAKSPLTGIWGESDVGGTWGKELKWAGYDALIISGKAAAPVYVYISNDKVEIVSAAHIWGKDTYETSEILERETIPGAVSAVIGPAGEKLVRIASIMHDGSDGRAAGRTGLGAVMGSKNLKAVVVKGNEPPSVAHKQLLIDSVRSKMKAVREGTIALRDFGTAGSVLGAEKMGDLPIRNWRDGSWAEGAAKTSGQKLAETYLTGN